MNILTAAAVTGIIAAPATMLLVAGQFDLSVGSGGSVLRRRSIASLALHDDIYARCGDRRRARRPGALGPLNGFLVTMIGINALITTLGTLGRLPSV